MAIIDFPGPPAPNGYSHTVVVAPGSRLVCISGQVPVAADGKVPEGWAGQTRLTFRNVEAALAAGEIEAVAAVPA
jgi:enamine deaminase RidA (YjgF/YER057c/UK114 family)